PDSASSGSWQYAYRRGATTVCAAGNSGQEGVGYPAAYPECIAVSALGPTGKLSYYSSWGKQVAISAPGGDKQHGEDKGILQNTYLRRYDRTAENNRLVYNAPAHVTSPSDFARYVREVALKPVGGTLFDRLNAQPRLE